MQSNQDILYLAKTNFRNKNERFGIRQADRLLHTYIIGKTGTGKTTLLETMLMQDIQDGRGCCLLDPHGDLVSKIAGQIPEYRQQDVIYLDITDINQPWGYNPIKRVSFEKRPLIASSILEVFKKLWSNAWGPKLEHIFRFTLLALLDQPKATMADIPTMLMDKDFRKQALVHVESKEVKEFWKKEFPRYMQNDILPVLNKVGSILVYPAIRRVIIENRQEISLRKAIDNGKILLVNLSKGAVGEDVCQILGALLLTSLASAAFSRVDIPEEHRKPFHIVCDEAQNFATLSLVNMLSELRKYKVSLTLSHQYMNQLETEILDAVLGNVGTHICFRIDAMDANRMAQKMLLEFEPIDFMYLPNYHIYLTLMIDGKPSKPFSAITICPV
ncbi:MAG: type IV secretory system conjugative DNA transfer family protein [Bacteroidia bacterium]